MDTSSKLVVSVRVVATHEGEQTNLEQKDFVSAIRNSIETLIKEEHDDEDLPVNISIYAEGFEYSDNLEAIRSTIGARLTSCDADTLSTLMEIINHD